MICERCGTVFCWDDADEGTIAGNRKRYCSLDCKTGGRGRGRSRGNPRAPGALQRRRRRHRREHQLRDCLQRPKNPYETREEAETDAARVWSESGVALHPYECACGFWHLTSVPQEAVS